MPGHPSNVAASTAKQYVEQRIVRVGVSLGFPIRFRRGFALSSDEGEGYAVTS